MKHIKRLQEVFEETKWDKERQMSYFRNHRNELSFVTAKEQEMEMDMSEFYA
jgi:hypothetical protein